ncbi:hypothetical protein AB0B40_29670 [Streptomyces sp. NPDC042638]
MIDTLTVVGDARSRSDALARSARLVRPDATPRDATPDEERPVAPQ